MDPYQMEAQALCAGFTQGEGGEGRIVPACMRIPAKEGRYRLSVSLSAQQDVPEALLFTNHRRLIWRGELRAGEMTGVNVLVLAHPFLPEDADTPEPFAGVELALLAPGAQIGEVCLTPAQDSQAVMLMGDSTVTDQGAQSPYAPGATYGGWGQMLPAFLGEGACVGNFARSGMTVETFRTEGLYDLMMAQLRPGDLVLMQFGHNDQKRMHLQAEGGYADALAVCIGEIRARGAQPVVVTPLARNSWRDENTYMDLLHAFARAAKRTAAQQAAPVIDLHAFMRARLERDGRENAKVYFHVGDYTHTNDFGAYAAAGFIAGELTRLGLLAANPGDAWLPHGPYDVPASHQGDEAMLPSGLEALYRDYETCRPDAPLTRLEALELTCRTCGLFTLNELPALPADVPLGEPYTADILCGLQHGLIPPHMLEDGKFHRRRAVSAQEFAAIFLGGYAMRRPVQGMDIANGEIISRSEAAAICRKAVI